MKTLVTSICLITVAAGTAQAEYKVLGKKLMDDIRAQKEASRVQEVYDYKRDAFRPQGMKVASFKVDATATAKVAFDDNIYATDTHEKSDMIISLRPEVTVNSNWNRHQLTAVAYVERKEFMDYQAEETTKYGARARARVDVSRNSYATIGGSYALSHDDRSNPDSNAAAVEPTEYAKADATVGYTHAVGKVSLAGRVDHTNYDYEDGQTATGVNIDNDTRDRDETRYIAEVGYAVAPAAKGFVRGTVLDVDYDDKTSGRSGAGHKIVVGAKGDLSGTVNAEAYAGIMQRRYDAGYLSVNEPTYGGNLLWSATPLTSVKASLDRTIDETTAVGASGVVKTNTGVEVQHELKRNILWGGNVNFINSEYEGLSREDDTTKAGIDVKYLLNRHLSVGAGYNFSNRDSNVNGNNYDRNALMFTLTGAM